MAAFVLLSTINVFIYNCEDWWLQKGITTWKVLLVTSTNDKMEVEMNLVKVKGINEQGKEESYSANVINKITL